MKLEDVVVGEMYRMILAETEENEEGKNVVYLKKDAVVRVIHKTEFGNRIFVQDLSAAKDRNDDGRWYTAADKLEPLKETVSYASEALAHYTAKEEANKHYITAHQPIEVMQANMTHDELIGFLKGNIIKYACRCGRKDEPLKEAEKIKQYAEWLCVVLSDGTIDPRS
nr:MAG TPA: nucelotide kinase [Caudoviricetes sp.]